MFNLKRKTIEAEADSISLQTYAEIAPKKDVQGPNFAGSEIQYEWNINGLSWWNPRTSYLRGRFSLTKGNGQMLTVDDGIAPAANLMAQIFQSMRMRMNDVIVSQINNFVPQVDAIENRMTKNKAWLASVGASLTLTQTSYDDRLNMISADGAVNTTYDKQIPAQSIQPLTPNGNFDIPEEKSLLYLIPTTTNLSFLGDTGNGLLFTYAGLPGNVANIATLAGIWNTRVKVGDKFAYIDGGLRRVFKVIRGAEVEGLFGIRLEVEEEGETFTYTLFSILSPGESSYGETYDVINNVLTYVPGGGGLVAAARAAQFNRGSYINVKTGVPITSNFPFARVLTVNAGTAALTIEPNIIPDIAAQFTPLWVKRDLVNYNPIDNINITAYNLLFIEKQKVRHKGSFELCWTPPLAIFNVPHALPVGNYSLWLQPVSDATLQRMAVETVRDKTPYQSAVLPGDYRFTVESLMLMIHRVQGERVKDGPYYLDLSQTRCQTHNLTTNNYAQKNFDVSTTTTSLTIAYQDGRVNLGQKYQASKFTAEHNAELALTRLQVDFAAQQKPSPDGAPQLQYFSNPTTKNVDYTTHMYMNSLIQNGLYYAAGGAETLVEWQERGAFYHFDWQRDAQDKSTNVKVYSQFAFNDAANTGMVPNSNLLLFDNYKAWVTVQIKDGSVASVQYQES